MIWCAETCQWGKECVDFLRGRMREFGSSKAFVVTESQRVKVIACDMVRKGYLLDAIITANNYSVASVRECGIEPSLINRSLRVHYHNSNFKLRHGYYTTGK